MPRLLAVPRHRRLALACARPHVEEDPPFRTRSAAGSHAADRSAADRGSTPAGIRPETLAFFGIGPGMRVAELGAGGGYTAELLARVVGPKRHVSTAQNSLMILEPLRGEAVERAAREAGHGDGRPRRSRVRRPAAAGARTTSTRVVMILFYHDTVWMGVDRAADERRRLPCASSPAASTRA